MLKENENEYQVATGNLLLGTNLILPRIDRETWLGWVPKNQVILFEKKYNFNPEDLV
ncbi:hypothetical protein JOC77_001090 [Peribacillus deserti]|uniref:Uncharacterized protein n=1 Tax=Peribacillus deserti TaxID=673318 RepID=A0ABS2QEV9_9BACI|nr:hypothetical protein [Peribacillus deserti]